MDEVVARWGIGLFLPFVNVKLDPLLSEEFSKHLFDLLERNLAIRVGVVDLEDKGICEELEVMVNDVVTGGTPAVATY